MRSRTQLHTTPVNHFVDPSLGASAPGLGVGELSKSLEAAGLHLESLVARGLRVYSQPPEAALSSWRDSWAGAQIDIVLKLPDGMWAGIKIKLGENAADEAATSLLRMADKTDHDRHGEPAALIVTTGGRYSYKRADGVCIVPITALSP